MIILKKGMIKGASFSLGLGLGIGAIIKMDDLMYN